MSITPFQLLLLLYSSCLKTSLPLSVIYLSSLYRSICFSPEVWDYSITILGVLSLRITSKQSDLDHSAAICLFTMLNDQLSDLIVRLLQVQISAVIFMGTMSSKIRAALLQTVLQAVLGGELWMDWLCISPSQGAGSSRFQLASKCLMSLQHGLPVCWRKPRTSQKPLSRHPRRWWCSLPALDLHSKMTQPSELDTWHDPFSSFIMNKKKKNLLAHTQTDSMLLNPWEVGNKCICQDRKDPGLIVCQPVCSYALVMFSGD